MDWRFVCFVSVLFSLIAENVQGAWCDAALKDRLHACLTIFNEVRGATSTTICPALSQMIICSNTAAGNIDPNCDEFNHQAQTATNWYKDHDCGSLNAAVEQEKIDPAAGTSLTSAVGGESRAALVPPTVSPLVKAMRQQGQSLACSSGFLRLEACWDSFEKQIGVVPQGDALCRAMDVFLLCYQNEAQDAMLTCDQAVRIIEKSQQMFDQYKCATYNVQHDVANTHNRPASVSSDETSGSSSGTYATSLGVPIWTVVLLGLCGLCCFCACLVSILQRDPKSRSARRSMDIASGYAYPHPQASPYNLVQMPVSAAPMQAYAYQQGAQNHPLDLRGGYSYTQMPVQSSGMTPYLH